MPHIFYLLNVTSFMYVISVSSISDMRMANIKERIGIYERRIRTKSIGIFDFSFLV